MRTRLLPQLRITFTNICYVRVRGQYLDSFEMICVGFSMRKRSIPQLRITLNLIFGCFVCVEVYASITYPEYIIVGYIKKTIHLVYAYVVTYIRLWSYICDILTYVYILDYVIHIKCFPNWGRGFWWPSSHFCENGVVTIPFINNFYCWNSRWSLWYFVT